MVFLLILFTIAAWYILDYFYAPKRLSNEPPLFPQSVPYVGHILGLLRYGTRYYEMMSLKCKLPIYTLNMLNGKVYVVTSSELVSAVNRNAKTLAFNPFIAQLGKRITGHDQATSLIVQHNLNGENGSGYVIDVHDSTVTALAPGNSLEEMTSAMIQEVSVCLTALDQGSGGDEIDFFAWTRRTVTMCSTKAIYGPENPFNKNPKLEQAFWEFDHDLNLLMLNVAPSILAPKGYRARADLGAAFTEYFRNYIPRRTQSSAMILARYTANTQHGVSLWNQGRLEVGTLIGILANTIPSLFYMLVRIYADENLLQDIRAELEANAVLNRNGEKNSKKTLMILSMREKCHLLHATFQELLRFHARGASARYVREDTMLDDDRYLLRKGMIVHMPMAVMHFDPAIWGPDAAEFRPERFLRKISKSNNNQRRRNLQFNEDEEESRLQLNPSSNSNSNSNSNEQKVSNLNSTSKQSQSQNQTMTGYRPFGGGASLCPGRHFVTLEALALTAIMVLRYDIEPVNVDRRWTIPPQKQESLATNVFPPASDIKVTIRRRKGQENIEWGFLMT